MRRTEVAIVHGWVLIGCAAIKDIDQPPLILSITLLPIETVIHTAVVIARRHLLVLAAVTWSIGLILLRLGVIIYRLRPILQVWLDILQIGLDVLLQVLLLETLLLETLLLQIVLLEILLLEILLLKTLLLEILLMK